MRTFPVLYTTFSMQRVFEFLINSQPLHKLANRRIKSEFPPDHPNLLQPHFYPPSAKNMNIGLEFGGLCNTAC
jgi:hypothetical protein